MLWIEKVLREARKLKPGERRLIEQQTKNGMIDFGKADEAVSQIFAIIGRYGFCWVEHIVMETHSIFPEHYIVPERRFKDGEIDLGEVNEHIKQLFTAVRRYGNEVKALGISSREGNEIRKEMLAINYLLGLCLKDAYDLWEESIEIRKGFRAAVSCWRHDDDIASLLKNQ